MFRFTQETSSGSQCQCLAKIKRHGSTVLVDMNVVSVMAAYSDLLSVCVVHRAGRSNFLHGELYF